MMQKIAIVFPGQGSQAVGMLDSFAANNPELVADICQQASVTLGYDMALLISQDPQQLLNQTEYTQPALLTAGYIAWRIWQLENSEQPVFFAGHSLGEYTALVCAQALSFADGLKLVKKRGQLMQAAVAPGAGAMAAILGLELAQVNTICNEIGAVQAANLNAPGQIVIAGTANAVELAIAQAKNLGAKRAIMLPVSVPSHCELMLPAAEKFLTDLNSVTWSKPLVPVIHNYDVASYTDSKSIIIALQKQLYSPVHWIETIEYMVSHGVTEIIECGPGKVLTGLNKRIAPSLGTALC